jgi:hypothetical protein
VADHPIDPLSPVWVFVYDGYRPGIPVGLESGGTMTTEPEDRLLHVADAMNAATRDGAFVYIYGWTELGSPSVPEALPTVSGSG